MGESANRALMFGVGIFVTVIIISGIMFIFSQMKGVYKQVNSTDTSITARFGKYASYDNTEVTGLDVINCANKYYKENLVVVEYNGFSVNDENGINYLNDQYNNGILKYEDKSSIFYLKKLRNHVTSFHCPRMESRTLSKQSSYLTAQRRSFSVIRSNISSDIDKNSSLVVIGCILSDIATVPQGDTSNVLLTKGFNHC